jgi:RNase P subunit RPR2
VSESKPSSFPSSLRAKRSAVQTLSAEDRKTEAIIDRTCSECGRKQMFYTTVQLRSADEGSTVFYRCVCGFKYAHPFRKHTSIHVQEILIISTGKPRTINLADTDCTKDVGKGLFLEKGCITSGTRVLKSRPSRDKFLFSQDIHHAAMGAALSGISAY